MPDLIAQGPLPEQRWRRKLPPGATLVIGRAAGIWSTPWDERISRKHVELTWLEGRAHVSVAADARNPVFFRGHKADKFDLRPGDHFVIGQTTFTLVDERANVAQDLPRPAGERTFTIEELRGQPFQHADKRIDVLSRLPDIISGSASEQEMLVRLVNLLLTGVERASAAAVVEVGSRFNVQGSKSEKSASTLNVEPETLNPVSILHWDRRALIGADFRPSERLIRQAAQTGESTVFVWSANRPRSEGDFTVSEGIDWALCVPVAGPASAGWFLYVTGSFPGDLPEGEHDAESLRDDVKFAELTAATMSALRESHVLARRQASLSQFFSPVVLEALAQRDAEEVLSPREADVTVLFCDLRGFTEQSERLAGDLAELLARVSKALGVMTHHILEQGGVVGDFHGDAAMGFWGWPLPQPDAVERACRAALGIRAAFRSPTLRVGQAAAATSSFAQTKDLGGVAGDPVPHGARDYVDFRVGIGIASGRAFAGKIGSTDQVKVTVFGPVVNLASRLETMTKQIRASILIDPPTAAVLRASAPASVARVRKLAKVRPAGFSAPLEVSELLPPADQCPELSDAHLAAYEEALAAFGACDWNEALRRLHQIPPDDQAKDFLTVFIAQHNRTPPDRWDGAIPLGAK
ncbi:MAG: adenylate/guanylate cyclase domain-containing protein [Planctomycetaceae bacterium]|nr:adenylate/guanylate cyclase domain-containing protein [Planctomycetaceae bacterium]